MSENRGADQRAPGVTGVTVMTADTGRLIADQATERHRAGACSPPAVTAASGSPACATPFPAPDKARLHDAVDHLRLLRNRIAHHEPVHSRDLVGDYTRILDTAERISSRLAWWIDTTSRVPALLDTRPTIR